MTGFGLRFHHLGLALRAEEQALGFLRGMGYEAGERVYDPEQDVHLRLCTAAAAPAVETITPGEGEGPLTPILKRYDQLVYHTCYEVDDVAESLARIGEAGLRVLPVGESKPAVLFGGRHVSFHRVVGFGLIELLDAV